MLVSETGELVGATRAVGIGQRLVRSDGERLDSKARLLLREGRWKRRQEGKSDHQAWQLVRRDFHFGSLVYEVYIHSGAQTVPRGFAEGAGIDTRSIIRIDQ